MKHSFFFSGIRKDLVQQYGPEVGHAVWQRTSSLLPSLAAAQAAIKG